MDGLDDFPNDDVWSPSLREELFSDYNIGSYWESDARQHVENLQPPRPSLPSTNLPSQPTLIQQQQQRLHQPDTTHSAIYNFHGSAPLDRKHSHLDLPNFPLATDPTGLPSNTSGRPLPPSTTQEPPQHPTQLPPPSALTSSRPVSPLPYSFLSVSPPLRSLESDSEGPDSPWPDSLEGNSDGFVDLTQDSSPPNMPSSRHTQFSSHYPRRRNALRRSLSEHLSEDSPNPAKRRKTGTEASQTSQRSHKIEEVDLRDVDDDRGLSKVLEQQRLATIKAQKEQASKPVKLSTLQCIICMENMKDVTATHCGHLFCHTCLMEALIAGENQGSDPGKGTPKCPVCRKKVMRSAEGSHRKSRDFVPLAMKVKSRNKNDKGKGRAVSDDWV